MSAADTPIKVCDPNDPDKCSTALKKGQEAPYAGQLLSVKLAISLGQKAEFCDERLKLKLDFQKKTLDIELDLEKRLRKLNLESFTQQKDLLINRLEEAHSRPWYESPLFIAVISVTSTILVFIGATETVKALK